MQSNLDEDVLIEQPQSLDERFAAARAGRERLRLTMPVVVDGMDDAVNETFAAWPERIYIVRTDGVVAFAGGPGPYEFDPDAAEAALVEVLGA